MLPKSDGSPGFTGRSDGDDLGGLVFDTVGNLYGTTYFGGNANETAGGRELRGLRVDKMKAIRYCAKLLSDDAA